MPETYVSLEEAEDYFATRLNTQSWDDADNSEREKALYQATRAIDNLNFAGCKASTTQTLQFPRGDDTVTPSNIKNAVCEEALALLDGAEPHEEMRAIPVISHGFAQARTTYNRDFVPMWVLAGLVSPVAWTLLYPYLRDSTELTLSRVS